MYGDANEDGLINMQDVTKIERIILEYDEPTETADANQDGVINMLDVTNIELIILGKLPHPDEENEGEIEIIEYYVEKDSSEYKTEVFSEGEYIYTYITEYNPLEFIETEDKITTNQIQASGDEVLIYIWDDVFFIQGDGIKYPHPDYSIYRMDFWENEKIEGEELMHWHIGKKNSSIIAGAPPVLGSTILALIMKNPYLKVVDAVLGFALTIHSVESYADETGCMWVWYPKDSEDFNFHFFPWPYLSYSYVPDYLRISSNTAWDFMDKGDP